MAILAGDIKKGVCLRLDDGKIWVVIDFLHKKPGKGKDKVEMRLFDKKKSCNHYAYRADIKTVTFKVNKKAARHKNVEAMAMAVRGVKDANYNRRSGKITVKYDANKTSVRSIKHAVN